MIWGWNPSLSLRCWRNRLDMLGSMHGLRALRVSRIACVIPCPQIVRCLLLFVNFLRNVTMERNTHSTQKISLIVTWYVFLHEAICVLHNVVHNRHTGKPEFDMSVQVGYTWDKLVLFGCSGLAVRVFSQLLWFEVLVYRHPVANSAGERINQLSIIGDSRIRCKLHWIPSHV